MEGQPTSHGIPPKLPIQNLVRMPPIKSLQDYWEALPPQEEAQLLIFLKGGGALELMAITTSQKG